MDIGGINNFGAFKSNNLGLLYLAEVLYIKHIIPPFYKIGRIFLFHVENTLRNVEEESIQNGS